MEIKVYTPKQQGIGAFDGGKITEQKPIGFPGEGSKVMRIGPLFYWAWAKSKEAGFIPSHPHEGFEIITYVVNGKAEHGDSLGTKSTIGPGGIQVMQTGSGVYHQEGFIGPDFDGFQIWFEPYLNEAIFREPSYSQYNHQDFSISRNNDSLVKKVIGEGSPVQLVADVQMWDIEIQSKGTYSHSHNLNKTLTILAFKGQGNIATNDQFVSFNEKDFTVVNSTEEGSVTIEANNDLRLILIEVPTNVDYPVYPK